MNIKDAIFGAQSPQKLAAASDDLQGSLPIADIDRGIIYTRDGGLVGLFEVLPMNFFLQSTSERVRIVGALAAWLKIAPNSVQILGLSQPVDVGSIHDGCTSTLQLRQMQAVRPASRTISSRSAV